MKLKEKYEKVCSEYIEGFCKKQDMEFMFWVADVVGGTVCCSDFYFNFSDIIIDIDYKQPKGQIVDWYYENIENPEKHINYYSYTIGLRHSDIK